MSMLGYGKGAFSKEWFPAGFSGDHRVRDWGSIHGPTIECVCGAVFGAASQPPRDLNPMVMVANLFIHHCEWLEPAKPLGGPEAMRASRLADLDLDLRKRVETLEALTLAHAAALGAVVHPPAGFERAMDPYEYRVPICEVCYRALDLKAWTLAPETHGDKRIPVCEVCAGNFPTIMIREMVEERRARGATVHNA